MNRVVIVESPSKSKTIAGYLGDGYTVLSSKGHICDLATSGKEGLGINIEEGFVPTYKIMPDKTALVKSLKKECKGHEVYLATDPDREGEAIAYHLAKELGLDLNANNRIEFHEITKDAVKKALENPHQINLKMVDSQETRRMIDRILGFKLSKLLQRKIGSKSAGRVQSATLLLIVELEKKIQGFVPTKYYEDEALFTGFKLKLCKYMDDVIDSKNRICNREILENLNARLLSFVVSNITNKQVTRNSQPTYTTSTMQQDAVNKLGFSPTKTMRIAQGLYEGKNVGNMTVGLITYMRTDSTRLAETFVNDANNYIQKTFGNKYLGSVKTKTQKNAQDAHEGIRPTSIDRTPDSIRSYLTDDEYKLYKLIYNRTLASLMASAQFNSTRVEFTNTDSVWYTTGQQLIFDGFLKVYGKSEEDSNSLLPNFKLGESYNANEVVILDKETTPPARYTEASLIKDMEELGIGRPSTYAQTIYTLKERKYVELEKKSLIPTEQGIKTINSLLDYFSDIINVKYTANMENNLDEIASGEKNRLEELNEFYNNFIPLFDNARENMAATYPIETDEICPLCGGHLVIRLGKYGEFTSCGNYPQCKYIKKEEDEDADTGILCPECGKANILRKVAKKGRNAGAIFYACGNYPKCKVIYNDEPTDEVCPKCGSMMLRDKDGNLYCSKDCDKPKMDSILCPVCGKGHLIMRTATRGANKGNHFYSCDNFPKCKAIYNDEPTNEVCPKCGSMMLKNKDGNLYCSKKCDKTSEELPLDTNPNDTGVLCPKCNKGHMIMRTATRGANKGNHFYGCSNYPRCKNILSEEEFANLNK